ncbi:MAG: hypothetical protein NC432_08660 [Roseburia sp.]|nr:hypothetical protein [Roseburia sp.]MCM1097816.1 hypothetical protein [Ruminococcus flavefaciens]
MKGTERVSVMQAAEELGVSPQAVRVQMERGLLDIGVVLPSLQGDRKQYWIYREKLNRLLGRKEKEG